MGAEQRRGRHWVTVLVNGAHAAVTPVLLVSSVGLGAAGVLLEAPLEGAAGVLVACTAALLERSRLGAVDDRLVRMRTRLRVARQRSDGELVQLREQVRALDLELWEYRLVDQMGPQARTLISGMAATLARPYVPQAEPMDGDVDWEGLDTHPIDLAAVRAGEDRLTAIVAGDLDGPADAEPPAEPPAEAGTAESDADAADAADRAPGDEPPPLPDLGTTEPVATEPVTTEPAATEPAAEQRPAPAPAPRRAPSPHHPEPPTIDLPVIRPGVPAGAAALTSTGSAPVTGSVPVVDLRSRPAAVGRPVTDVAELDEQVYQQIAEAAQDELTAAMEPPARRPAAAVAGVAAVPDDPGRRTALTG